MPSVAAVAGGLSAVLTGAHLVPSVAAIGPLRRTLLPALCGTGRGARGAHVALTFDDGPDARSTPLVLDELARLELRATFFLLGSQVARAPEVARRATSEGHEVAVHGWSHMPHLLRSPWAVAADIRRARDLIADVTGTCPRFWRPPHGIATGAGLLAARRIGLRPVLWTADGQDWAGAATAESIAARIRPRLRAGAVVLLHDSDITSAAGSWRAMIGSLAPIVRGCRERRLEVGPLGEHFAISAPAAV